MRLSLFTAVTVALFLAMGCSDDTSSSGVVTKGASLSLSCVEDTTCGSNSTAGSVAASQLDVCAYKDTTKALRVQFVEPTAGRIEVLVEPFTGDSSYQTTADGKIDVVVATKGTVPSNATASGPPEHKCTIKATSNLSKIQIPSTGDANILDVALDVTCPMLDAGATCAMNCAVTPANFQLSVKGCTVSK